MYYIYPILEECTPLSLTHNRFDVSGFILTRQRVEIKGKIYIEYWLSSDSGPVKVTTSDQRELFFVRQIDLDRISNIFSDAKVDFEAKNLSLKDFQQELVSVIYFKNSYYFYKARELLDRQLIVSYENDIRISNRFLMERFIYGSMSIMGESTRTYIKQSSTRYLSFKNTQCKGAIYSPTFKVLSIDIECSEKGVLYSIGLAAEDYQCVLMIGEQELNAPAWIRWCDNEETLLRRFIEEINSYDPDVFIGWNVVNFDFRLLIKRAEFYKKPLTIGRDNQEIRWRDASGEEGKGYVFISGRVVIDGIDALKTATYHFSSFSLECVSRELLGKGKLSDDHDDRMAEINRDFNENKIKLAKYNLQDCLLVSEIFEKTKLLDFLVLRSQLTGLELDRSGGSVAAFINLYLPKLHRAGYVSPNRPEDGGLASPGGYVMSSLPGLYRHVLVLDFKSLYPSIIRTFKVDPVGLIEGLKNPESGIEGYKGALFSRDKHFLPDIITSLWQQRDEAKKSNDAARSQAIKILMNSFYGVLGSGGCPFYDTRLASSITLRGHDIMQTTMRWIEDEGYTVIYGDTDSIFVWLDLENGNAHGKNYNDGNISNGNTSNGNTSNEKTSDVVRDKKKIRSIAFNIGKSLQYDINRKWKDKIAKEFSLESHLDLEFETYFSRFLMPTIRGSALGSKKRYAGIKETDNGQELIFKGLETVRSDWTPLAKRFQHTLYNMVFSDQDTADYIVKFIADTRAGYFDHLLVYRKRLRRRLENYIKNIPPHVRAARLADDLNRASGNPLRYQHKGWISYVITLNGPQAIEHRRADIDYDHYVEKQLRPIAEAILPFVGQSFERITCAQFGLF